MYTYQGTNDCAIVSISNYTGRSYKDVVQAASEMANISILTIHKNGTPEYAIILILAKLTGKCWKTWCPKRNQHKINGLVSLHNPGRKNGHMVACVDGQVFDTDGKVYPLSVYKVIHNYMVRRVYSE
jgi:hypothetical protein